MRRLALASLVLGFAGWGIFPASADIAEDTDANPNQILDKYVAASKAQSEKLKGLQMDVDIQAQLPKLQKSGTMHALRSISKLGQITYNYFRWNGDSTIKKDVIARWLSAETEAKDLASIAITPSNYKFKYKGLMEREGRVMYVFQLAPKKKAVGLYKGEMWLDQATCMPVREFGKFVKSPSVAVKSIEFVREYEMRDGVSYPKHIQSTLEVRLGIGKAEISIDYSNFSKPDVQAADANQNGNH